MNFNTTIIKIASIIFTALVCSTELFSQETIVDDGILAEYEMVLIKEYNHLYDSISIDSVVRLSEKHSKVLYHSENTNYEAHIDTGREEMLLLATYTEIPESEVPKIVRDNYLEIKKDSWNTLSAYRVQTPHDSFSYALEYTDKDTNLIKIHFDKYGNKTHKPYK